MARSIIQTGQRNKRITIQVLTKEIVNGKPIEKWVDKTKVWCSVKNLHGSEFFQAQAVNSKASIKFNIRYMKDLDANMRIVFNNKNYNILYVDNINEANIEIELMCEVIS